jgi:DinB superfamily
MYDRAMNYEDVRTQLARTPAVLNELLRGAPERLWRATEGPGTWSPAEIVCHLLHGEDDDWIPRIRLIVEQGGRTPFTTFDREGGMNKYGSERPERLLALFETARHTSLAVVDGWRISDSMLALTGIHPELGQVTLGQLLACWATHDAAHLAQITRVLVRHYGQSVGPWRAFFSLLRDAPAVS